MQFTQSVARNNNNNWGGDKKKQHEKDQKQIARLCSSKASNNFPLPHLSFVVFPLPCIFPPTQVHKIYVDTKLQFS